MKKEIGSEFWDVPVTSENNGFFPADTRWYISGRSALKAILSGLKDCRTAALPSWCCDTMIKPFIEAGMEVSFYPVYFRDGLVREISFESDVLLVMDYFGFRGKAPDLSGYEGTVIRDVTHSMFSGTEGDADHYFGSLRKWCGVWTGGFAFRGNGEMTAAGDPGVEYYADLRREAMELKYKYMNGLEPDGKPVGKEYLDIFGKAEDHLDIAGITAASERDVELAGRLDIEFIRSRRRKNARILMDAFRDWLIFPELKDEDCPLFVPVMVPDGKRDQLRRFLIENEIYCPVHWPVSEYHRLEGIEKDIYDSELSLVCDQRYSEDDMIRIAEMTELFRRKG